MAISRREIVRLGVSYGTGVMNHGNDSIVYDRALKRFPEEDAHARLCAALKASETDEALQAAHELQQRCSELALSTLRTKCAPVVSALEEGCLPAVEELEELDRAYRSLTEYLSHV